MAASSGGIQQGDLNHLIELMSKNAYRAKDAAIADERILYNVLSLFGRDYQYSVIKNDGGELCNHYPSKIVLLEYETQEQKHDLESLYDIKHITDLFSKARLARCRTRFVVPVILIDGKHICRSATISGGGEVYGRIGLNMMFSGSASSHNGAARDEVSQVADDQQTFDRIRGNDIKLLKELKIEHICDLMLENKKVKCFVNVTSSEKVDKFNRYSSFKVWSLPYPGCEFFKVWRENNYQGERSLFDWNQDFVNATLEIPNETHLKLDIPWSDYKSWNLILLTQNYMRVLLKHIQDGDQGLLVHCISGWDRTPLFISLLRISLWADGLIHKNLSALELLYLTVSYDWYLFGHNLPDRLAKGEEIFFFCFHFLKHIQDDSFVCRTQSQRQRHMSRADSDLLFDENSFPPYGSDLSLSSDCSSHRDTPPHVFTISIKDDHSNTSNSPLEHSESSVNGSSRPMFVPEAGHYHSSADAQSPSLGSWQVVTGTGSLVESPSFGNDRDRHKSSSSGSEPAVRRQCLSTLREERLGQVRTLFYQGYNASIGFDQSHTSSSGALSNLLGMVANKVASISNKLN